MRLPPALHLTTAVVAWGALAVQFWLLAGTLMAGGATPGFAAWRFLGCFTILTIGVIAIALGLVMMDRHAGTLWRSPSADGRLR
jgi:hypothetical protein